MLTQCSVFGHTTNLYFVCVCKIILYGEYNLNLNIMYFDSMRCSLIALLIICNQFKAIYQWSKILSNPNLTISFRFEFRISMTFDTTLWNICFILLSRMMMKKLSKSLEIDKLYCAWWGKNHLPSIELIYMSVFVLLTQLYWIISPKWCHRSLT